jgi:hypothetical protein
MTSSNFLLDVVRYELWVNYFVYFSTLVLWVCPELYRCTHGTLEQLHTALNPARIYLDLWFPFILEHEHLL